MVCLYSSAAFFSSTSATCISLSRSLTKSSIITSTHWLSSDFLEYALGAAGGGPGAVKDLDKEMQV